MGFLFSVPSILISLFEAFVSEDLCNELIYFKRGGAQKLRPSAENLHIFVEVWEPFCTVKICSWEIIQVGINI